MGRLREVQSQEGGGDKNKYAREIWSLRHQIVTASVKYSPTAREMDVNFHTKGLFTSVPIIQYDMFISQQKYTKHGKRYKKTPVWR